ncbi:hypothetical protein J1N35_020877 [Gossypium stocksii]|uniref:Zinc knuckle CX2CX4HX4C domain-containing protein n=1 Tax=Gossypium stocksii TaxID=47602 RepID=A0A9D3VDI3_9ROSI|nr:hypothetical protein J1N35_020877 [Gossypium stocksii]
MGKDPKSVPQYYVNFWVQIHDLPISFKPKISDFLLFEFQGLQILLSSGVWVGGYPVVISFLMAEGINAMFERLKFLEEESVQIISINAVNNTQGFETWEGKNIDTYEFNLSPFWLRVYNIPWKAMDCQTALDIGKAIGELVAIDWKDRNGGWTKFIRLKVKINVPKPLQRVVKLVGKDGVETICMLKYEILPDFCHYCGLIGHKTKKCKSRGIWRNGIELMAKKEPLNEDREESKTDTGDDSGKMIQKGKGKECEEDSISNSFVEKRIHKYGYDGLGRFRSKRKRQRGLNGFNTEESPSKIANRRLLEKVTPSKAVADDQSRQEQ